VPVQSWGLSTGYADCRNRGNPASAACAKVNAHRRKKKKKKKTEDKELRYMLTAQISYGKTRLVNEVYHGNNNAVPDSEVSASRLITLLRGGIVQVRGV
jgi:hypothetical protein